MYRYHVARRDQFRTTDGEQATLTSLAFGGITFDKPEALDYANDMNRRSDTHGTYFAVPAPFAGEV